MCASATIDLLIAFYVDSVLNNICHVTFSLALASSSLFIAVVKTARTYGNYLLLVLHLANIFLGNLFIRGLCKLLDTLR